VKNAKAEERRKLTMSEAMDRVIGKTGDPEKKINYMEKKIWYLNGKIEALENVIVKLTEVKT
jgi:peptidoglycan hydrolase CwlO-like protein